MANPILDLFLIETNSVETIGIADISSYPKNFYILNPSLEITPPGYNKKTVSFTTKAANFYRAVDLGIVCDGCADLPDGIWHMKFSMNPVSVNYVEKSFIRVEKLKKHYLDIFLKVDLLEKEDKKLLELLEKVEILISGAIAASIDCNMELAYKLYQKAEAMLDTVCL